MNNKIRAIITGVTGMVGEGVLHECLNHPLVESVLVINRRPCGVQHDKVTEIIHEDFHNLTEIKHQLSGYNACYFCMGVSSIGMKEPEYTRITYNLTMHVAETLHELNPEMTFTYVSGDGTSGDENGKTMWNRVKSKTENELLKLFKNAYMFRPGYIQPTKGLKNAYRIYSFTAPFYPILKTVFTGFVCTLQDLGLAMIDVTLNGYGKRIFENRDITKVANTYER
ncbi:MAG: NAD-dependent epimerase/dehydratase family protein [Calditrichaeota bacterium]|nr:MAG: NAD-dependent epimerase/dehydratase family protein [Calditrichota bacterium]MBL1207344.1 NAD-dependent epimerase/dehydratase family protein [Calditrichota bacterium]NOG47177.1 NAD-dependent epimerase/dehydratase family protein [Calditrichota bacterium]